MKFYIEITLIDNDELAVYSLWHKLYTQLHLAFVEQQDLNGRVPFGVSFPEYMYKSNVGGCLGSKLRIFAQSESALQLLNLDKWLSRLKNYIHCTDIRDVPSDQVTGYTQFRRKHVKGSIEKLARRRAKRMKISIEEAHKYYQNITCKSDLPFIQLKSLTNEQPFRLHIGKSTSARFVDEGFGTYGLSTGSTVPNF